MYIILYKYIYTYPCGPGGTRAGSDPGQDPGPDPDRGRDPGRVGSGRGVDCTCFSHLGNSPKMRISISEQRASLKPEASHQAIHTEIDH